MGPDSALLRVPLVLRECYATPGTEHRIFPQYSNYLTLPEVLEAWDHNRGTATHERFYHAGLIWKFISTTVASTPNTGGGRRGAVANSCSQQTTFLAVLDMEPRAAGQHEIQATPSPAVSTSTNGRGWENTASVSARVEAYNAPTPTSNVRQQPFSRGSSAHFANSPGPTSRPLIDLDIEHPVPASARIEPASTAPSTPPAGATTTQAQQPKMHLNWLAEAGEDSCFSLPLVSTQANGNSQLQQHQSPLRTSRSEAQMMPYGQAGGSGSRTAALELHQGHQRNKFIEDLLTASDSPIPMDRYKALIRLMSHLKRQQGTARISQPWKVSAWEDHHELLKQIIMVGECLARFGTAEFSGAIGNSNSSRAINTKDYATLLMQYLEANGPMFDMAFIGQLPQGLQDEALGVRSLLQTRCEANSIIFSQLIKHVGLEAHGGAGGGAVVYNTSVVSANPITKINFEPKTLVQVAAKAMSKITQKGNPRMAAAALGGLVALFLMKRKLFGGGRRKDNTEGEFYEEDNWRERRRSSGARGRRGGPSTLAERLVEDRADAERLALAHISACSEEVAKAQRNTELLTHDWRLGTLRLSGPANGIHPPGFEHVYPDRCSLNTYLRALDPYLPAPAVHIAPPSYAAVPASAPGAAALTSNTRTHPLYIV